MLENMLRPYIPHFEAARDRCNLWGAQVLHKLDQIRDAVADTEYPDIIVPMSQQGLQAPQANVVLGTVPLGARWVLDTVTLNCTGGAGMAASIYTLDGRLLWAARDAASGIRANYAGNDIEIAGGTSVVINLTGTAICDFYVQFRQRDDETHPRQARSGGGNEGVYSGTSVMHEGDRDIIDTGVPSAVLPVASGGPDV